jgi:hypothetical protein
LIRQRSHLVEDEIVAGLRPSKRVKEVTEGEVLDIGEISALPLTQLVDAGLVIVLEHAQEGNGGHVETLHH